MCVSACDTTDTPEEARKIQHRAFHYPKKYLALWLLNRLKD